MKKIFIIAGEASGDYLGSLLIKDMLSLNDNIEFYGIGGNLMQEMGLKIFFSIKELSIIGIWEAIKNIFRIKKLTSKTIAEIIRYKPDAIITIDSSSFNHRILKAVKRTNPYIKTIHYVAPPVWAWRKWRARSMYKFIDKLLVLFPFEVQLFKNYNLDTVFVGHPIATDKDFENKDPKISSNNTSSSRYVCTMLPGSRISELEKHLPILEKVSDIMGKNFIFYIPSTNGLEGYLREKIKNWKCKVSISSLKSDKVNMLYNSDIAIAASGTVTLELVRMLVPFVCIYKTSFFTALLVRLFITIKWVCIVNILGKENIVPELLQDNCTPENIAVAVLKLMDKDVAKAQREKFKKILQQLKCSKEKCAAYEILEVVGCAPNKK